MILSKVVPHRDRHRAAPWRSWLLLRRCATPALGGASGSKLKRLMGQAPCPHVDGALRPIDMGGCADGSTPQRPCICGCSVHRTRCAVVCKTLPCGLRPWQRTEVGR